MISVTQFDENNKLVTAFDNMSNIPKGKRALLDRVIVDLFTKPGTDQSDTISGTTFNELIGRNNTSEALLKIYLASISKTIIEHQKTIEVKYNITDPTEQIKDFKLIIKEYSTTGFDIVATLTNQAGDVINTGVI